MNNKLATTPAVSERSQQRDNLKDNRYMAYVINIAILKISSMILDDDGTHKNRNIHGLAGEKF
ncbi:hypothetical protein [Photorhabdus australis]|uniref:hypothetical protein n=1 Tax=Photorhabdus australis TaxID=286156 RepID=UPI001041C056|nr:hypothetical protein [Photorhabdus australis]